MNSFCGLFFATLLVYVQASDHPCDPWAADLQLDPNVKHSNPHGNQVVKYDEFIAALKDPVAFFVAWATKDSIFDEYPDFCTPNAHGKHCGDIYFETKLIKFDKTPTLDHETYFYSENEQEKTRTAFKIQFELADNDDLIYRAKEGSIKAFDKNQQDVTNKIPPVIMKSLEGDIAVYRHEQKYSIHVTCDVKYAWVNLKHGVQAGDVEAEVAKWMVELAKIKRPKDPNSPSYKNQLALIPYDYSPEWKQEFSNVLPPMIKVE